MTSNSRCHCWVDKYLQGQVFCLFGTTTQIKKVKWPLYRSGVAQRMGRGIALLFHDCCTRRGWVISSTTRPHFTPSKDTLPILQEAGWATGSVWTGEKSRLHRDSFLDRPALSSWTILTELPSAKFYLVRVLYIQ